MTLGQQLHASATHKVGNDPECPVCNTLREAATIADGKSLMMGNTAHVKALVGLVRELAKGYYPISQSDDPAFMRMQARAAIERGGIL
jgi:hypothetical protein